MDKEGLGLQVRASPATWILQKTSSVRSFRKNEANCVIVVPDCRGTQFLKAMASQCVSLKKPSVAGNTYQNRIKYQPGKLDRYW
jgi:hypothetical protein